MDTKITKKRLNGLLSYEWLSMLLTITLVIVFWTLIFTTTATRVTPAQSFGIMNFTGSYCGENFNSYGNILKNENVFSYDILQISPMDLTMDKKYTNTLLQARFSTSEGDVLFAADVDYGVEDEYENDKGEPFKPTYLEQFLYGYYPYVEKLDHEENGYFNEYEEYINIYFDGDWKNNPINEEKVIDDFHLRIKKLKDKRFKTSTRLNKGERDEVARIQMLRDNLVKFYGFLDSGYAKITETTLYMQDDKGGKVNITGKFGINICPDESKSNLKKDVFYRKEVIDEEGNKKFVTSTENMNLVLLNTLTTKKYDYSRWESLGFVNYIIESNIIK